MDSVIGFHPQPGVGGTLASFTQKKILGQFLIGLAWVRCHF